MCAHRSGFVCTHVGMSVQIRLYRSHRVANVLLIQALIGAQGTGIM